jgi:hypothetical protein
MNFGPIQIRSMRELAHRSDGGIEVTLFWHPDAQELTVCVCDQRRGAYFEFEPEAEHALEAFYHPYSYASLSSVHYADGRLAA